MKFNPSYSMWILLITAMTGCQTLNWDRHPIIQQMRTAHLIRHLSCRADRLHGNYTPAVNKLSKMGMGAVEALLPSSKIRYANRRRADKSFGAIDIKKESCLLSRQLSTTKKTAEN